MDTNRSRYLVAYDICDAKRLYQVHKKVEAYAIGGQKSFYECWLTQHELIRFKAEIGEIMEKNEDRLMIFQLQRDAEPLLFGKAKLQSIQPFMLV
ncbi:CRISPR-associated protein Cas2 [Bibersteinia trehalosi Y31]|uniref:CRISPR-associated endoribonuclease Cas2 n=1 Tax=Bibersteinia trehalosi Y31 TaxID=1261658 RepID=A0A179D0K6_BIBTR|nr:CRISPR-associated endonuclease Cas2 [Bibersteinia trehalosi]OAQ15400.1 CRISPR-associated protein Cas2 [Bibersteinia trehalosi Y31]